MVYSSKVITIMPVIHITKENDEYQIIQSLKTNRDKRNKQHEIFIEGIEAFKQALAANVPLTRIIIYNGWKKLFTSKIYYSACNDWLYISIYIFFIC